MTFDFIHGTDTFQAAMARIWGGIETLSLTRADIAALYEKNGHRWADEPYDSISDVMGSVTDLATSEHCPTFPYAGQWLLAQKYEQQFKQMEDLPKWLGRGQITYLYAQVDDIPLVGRPPRTWPAGITMDYQIGLHNGSHQTTYGVAGTFDGTELMEFLGEIKGVQEDSRWADSAGLSRAWFASVFDFHASRA